MIYIFLSLTGLGDPWEWRITSSWFGGQHLEIPVHIDSPEFFSQYLLQNIKQREKNNTRSMWRADTWIWSLSFTNLLHQISIHFKAMTNLDSILKSRDITLLTKVHIVKALVFSVVMYGCESWTINKAERQKIDAFKLWCWRRLLRVSWIARRSNQSILKEINPEYSLEGLMLNVKLQYFSHLIQKADSLEKTLMLKDWGQEEKGDNRELDAVMTSWAQWTWVWTNSGS